MRRRLGVTLVAATFVGALAGRAPAAEPEPLEKEFKRRCGEMIGERVKGTMEAVLGHEGWVLLTSELAYAAIGRFWGPAAAAANPGVDPRVADPVPAILDFHRQLKERGVRLLFLPVPTRPVIYPEAVLGKAST